MKTSLAPLLYSLTLAATGCADDPAADMTMPSEEEPAPEEQPQPPAPQASGELDRDFGVGGIKSLTAELGDNYYATTLVAQGDKLLACLNEITSAGPVVHIVRFTSDGEIDRTFSTNGDLTIMPPGATQTYCVSMTIQPQGFHVIINQNGSYNQLRSYGLDGANVGQMVVSATPGKATPGTLYGGSVSAFGVNGAFNNPSVQLATSGSSWGFSAAQDYPGATLRGFSTDGVVVAVGSYSFSGKPAVWSTFKNTKGSYELKPTGFLATRGTAEADTMHDAVQLSNGTVFAVGGVDLDVEVMAAHFVGTGDTAVTIENHINGGVSTGRAIALDAMERPVVVGTATVDGKRAFGWQRYQPNSSKLDVTFGTSGIASIAAPVGEGELVDAVHIGDRTFAIGNYATDGGAYEVALVRIVD